MGFRSFLCKFPDSRNGSAVTQTRSRCAGHCGQEVVLYNQLWNSPQPQVLGASVRKSQTNREPPPPPVSLRSS